MSWNHRLHHTTFCILLRLAKIGFLPKIFLECQNKTLLGVSCQFGQAHRRPWCTKGKKIGSIQTPDQIKTVNGVSVDQIISAQPGLIPQMSGFITNQRIWGVTTFVNHVSDLVYVLLMRYLSLAEKFLAKASMEKTMAQAGRTVLHYHSDNGRFSYNGFVEAINSKDRNITFYEVGAHHQNDIVF